LDWYSPYAAQQAFDKDLLGWSLLKATAACVFAFTQDKQTDEND